MQGLIDKFFSKHSSAKGYGFISGEDENIYFFSAKELTNTVHVGDTVIFEGIRNEKGYLATDVRSVDTANQVKC